MDGVLVPVLISRLHQMRRFGSLTCSSLVLCIIISMIPCTVDVICTPIFANRYPKLKLKTGFK